jgi:transposase
MTVALNAAAEVMRTLSLARRSSVKAKTQAINQLRALLVSAPQDIRERLWKAKPKPCTEACARIRNLGDTSLLQALIAALKLLAKRWQMLAAELKEPDTRLDRLITLPFHRLISINFDVSFYTEIYHNHSYVK